MFQFSQFPPHRLCIQRWVTRHYSDRVSAFGDSRINALVQLPWTFRRLHALLRQPVPRHSSHTLCSLKLSSQLYRVLDMRFYSTAMQFSRFSVFGAFPSRFRFVLAPPTRRYGTSREHGCQGLVKVFSTKANFRGLCLFLARLYSLRV